MAARTEIAIGRAAIPTVRRRGIIGISAWASRARIARSRHTAPENEAISVSDSTFGGQTASTSRRKR